MSINLAKLIDEMAKLRARADRADDYHTLDRAISVLSRAKALDLHVKEPKPNLQDEINRETENTSHS